ncbi:hypothetical protein D3C73_1577700 [compost metagenome]
MHDQLARGFQQWIVEALQFGARQVRFLVQDELEQTGQRAFNRGTAEFCITL